MVVVAVAGGTGAVGQTIVNALVGSRQHKVFVLSRRHIPTVQVAEPQYLTVDYNDIGQIESALQEHEVEVVVSALVLLDSEAASSQINLIRGAAQSGTVTKFIPSEYHLNFHTPVDGIELSFRKFQLEAEEELGRHPELTWTLIRNGLFLDYLGMPFHPKPSQMMPWCILLDLQNEVCILPGDGTQPLTFTHSTDLAAFIERLIGLPAEHWPRESLVQSNKLKVNDLLHIVKNITGRDFKVTYDLATAVQEGNITQLPSNKSLFADPSWGELYRLVEKEAMLTILSNGYDLAGKDLANIFPDVPRTDIHDFLKEAWRLREKVLA